MTISDDKLDLLGEEIVCYLAKHPAAADSIEGVRRWWVVRQRFDEATAQVQLALDRLEAAGQIGKQVLPDGTAIYAAIVLTHTQRN